MEPKEEWEIKGGTEFFSETCGGFRGRKEKVHGKGEKR